MANKQLFGRQNANVTPSATATNTLNREGTAAYSLPHKHILAQYAATGCFNGTFYATAEAQLGTMLEMATVVEPEFLAKTAVYARRNRGMKDMPALLCAMLSILAPNLLEAIFTRVINDGRMLRNFVQIIRSGVLGRKSLGTMPRRLVRQWLDARGDDAIFRASVGNTDPRLTENTYMDERLLPIAEELSRIPAFAPTSTPSQSQSPAPKPTPITCKSTPVPHKAAQLMHKTRGSEGLGEASDGNSVAPEQNQDMVRKAIEMLAQAIAAASLGTNGQGSAPNGTEPSKKRVMGLEPTTFTLAKGYIHTSA